MQQLRVLVVDHNPAARERLHAALSDAYVLRFVSSAREAFAVVREEPPDLILSEVNLQDGDGFSFCQRLREQSETENLPFMFVTERASIQDKVAGFQVGADDYVVKPVDPRLFQARIRLLYRIKGLERREPA
jgi:DNA-binding response OmpR family regulator